MKISDYTNKSPGRPRSKRAHQAILTATRDILMSNGVHGLTIEGVAKKASVGKTTIYRHWKSKEALISEAIGAIADDIDIPDTGNALNDFTSVIKDLVFVTDDATNTSTITMSKLFAGLIDSPELMEVYKEQFILPRRQALKQIIEKGKERGEIRHDVNPDHLIDIIGGTFLYNTFINNEPLSVDSSFKKMMPIIMKGITPSTNKK